MSIEIKQILNGKSLIDDPLVLVEGPEVLKEHVNKALESSSVKTILITSIYFLAMCIPFSVALVKLGDTDSKLVTVSSQLQTLIQSQTTGQAANAKQGREIIQSQTTGQAANAKQGREIIHNQDSVANVARKNQNELDQHTHALDVILKKVK